eukprot:CAMPEP_0171065686 /NCGR_PEP_ID=MMETSP0766_2-20121228/6986_1 /TAXON_ID=439317 /ORGANISM="Gambierdiscus australes, Strain CAWD 149" /LENGTH=93 /DNA_ID=CAMNT_0011521803 /DNA_START=376 /DNA_END=657 /DNA_ORIENTATION=+
MGTAEVTPALRGGCVEPHVPAQCPRLRIPSGLWFTGSLACTRLARQDPHVIAALARAMDHILGTCLADLCEAAGKHPALVGATLPVRKAAPRV